MVLCLPVDIDAWGMIFQLTMVVLQVRVCEFVNNLFNQVDKDEACDEDEFGKWTAIVFSERTLVRLSNLER